MGGPSVALVLKECASARFNRQRGLCTMLGASLMHAQGCVRVKQSAVLSSATLVPWLGRLGTEGCIMHMVQPGVGNGLVEKE